ncbi:MAG: S8 family serine peptidase [Planctomycetota bacterium]
MNHATLRARVSLCALVLTPILASQFLASQFLASQSPTPVVTRAEGPAFLHLRFATFDPLAGEPAIPAALQSAASERLWIVQTNGTPTEAARAAVRAQGAEIFGYLPDDAYVVRMDAAAAAGVRDLADVRWVGRYHAAYRLEEPLIAALTAGEEIETHRYNVVVVDKHRDKPALGREILALGGAVVSEEKGSILFSVSLSGAQLLAAAHLDQVLWIDRWAAPEQDVDNARIQGGADYIETAGGFTGQGLNVHIYEGIDASHPAFSGPVINVLSGGASTGHGTNTAGIVFGDGTGNPQFRGLAPDVAKFYTNYSSVSTSRWAVVDELVNNRNVSHTTASWGDGLTTQYTSFSADADDIVFDHDIAWTNSQSNTGNQSSRPQAWAKNVFSIGGVEHFDNSNPGDDSWAAGGGSIGPASDGRMKPTLAAYYDNIGTTSQGGGYTTNFGGTSGATPIVAGHNILAIDMFTTEIAPGVGTFQNQLRNPGGSKHSNRPHSPTLKALQIANSAMYTPTATNNRRQHVGFGFPDLRRMYDYRNKTFLVDETDVLPQGGATRWDIVVAAGEPELRAVLNWADPAANPTSTLHLINNLSLVVTSPTGTVYQGNNGIMQGNTTPAGGIEDTINSLEAVVVLNPAPGTWHVDVVATAVVQDGHVETPAMDADYGLVVTGGVGSGGQPVIIALFETFGQGCPGSRSTLNFCGQLNGAGGTLAAQPRAQEIAYLVPNSGPANVLNFEVFTRSTTGGTVTVPAYIYLSNTGGPDPAPLASTTLTVGPAPDFYRATFAAPVQVTGIYYLVVDGTAGTVLPAQLSTGFGGAIFFRNTAGSGAWSVQGMISSWRVECDTSLQFLVPELDNQGLPQINTTYAVLLADATASSAAICMTGFSDTVFQGVPLPLTVPTAPGCSLWIAPDINLFALTDGTGAAQVQFTVPNDPAFAGLELFHQWAVFDTVNPLGVIVSGAARARAGA